MRSSAVAASERKCPIETVIQVLGGKWKPLILWHLLDSPKRFSELEKLIPEVTQKMLAQHLRELENDRLVTRTIYPSVPPKVEYRLSEYGQTMVPVLEVMCKWGETHNAPDSRTAAQITAQPM
ncbi:HxlR family transcriptional regulator [Cohnella xylanilytica]|uniref:Helix-turn-helix transcriptional regulator n=1 Tax=Cohnella xylanilytica TaxID=557555 RepID=A0A841TPJ2_9BACL|nr:helix-turn-helix domain-containing protein [Cohnella xylanilytica]MBB6690075.1 helix-turn-helix transcriptional regulator [Cohnella xylanilytica]GIO12127.1 HxlR family transcriptional regulator [Cohnella xylanilytica]